MKKYYLLCLIFILAIIAVLLVNQYKYLLWYKKIDIIKNIPPALAKIETNYFDFKKPDLTFSLNGNYDQQNSGVVIKYPGVSFEFYIYELKQLWIYLTLNNISMKNMNLAIWLNDKPVQVIEIKNDQKEIRILLPAELENKGSNTLWFVLGEQEAQILFANLYLSEYPVSPGYIAPKVSNEPDTVWIKGRGQITYYIDLPDDPYLVYSVSYTMIAKQKKDFTLNVKAEAAADGAEQVFEDHLKINSSNKIDWTTYRQKLTHFAHKKTRITFTLYFDDKNLLGRIALGLKAAIRGKNDSTVESIARIHKKSEYNVIIITLDAASASHFGCYGYTINATPHIDVFAQKSIVFTKAYTSVVFTRASVSSLFTSLYPDTHAVNDFQSTLPDNAKTLAEVFQENNYRTALFTANGNASHHVGLGQGFAEGYNLFQETPETITNNIIDWIKRNSAHKFFLYAHYLQPHPPYDAPRQLRVRFNTTHLPTLESNRQLEHGIYEGDMKLSREQIKYVTSQYDANLNYVDDSLNSLLNHILGTPVKNTTIVIITADHGEAMGYHNIYGHTWDLHLESIWIPLLLYYPENKSTKKINRVLSNLDIMPTLIDLLQLKGKPALMQGSSFAACIINDSCIAKNEAYTQSFASKNYSIIDGKYHFIFDRLKQTEELYNPNNDPEEIYNIIKQNSITSAFYKDKILRHIHTNHELNKVLYRTWKQKIFSPSNEVIENLKALGYIK